MSTRRFLLSRLVKEEIARSNPTAFETALEKTCRILADKGFRIPDKEGKPTMKPMTIDRRKLDRIAAGDDGVSLHVWEMRVLASYFERKHGVDLANSPLFEKVSIYESLTNGGKVSFLFGLRPDEIERANSLRLWDLRSMTAIAEEAYQTGHRLELDWHFIEPAAASIFESTPKGWNLISIGSPRANVASEVLLAKMFCVPAFLPEGSSRRPSLPFRFVWPQALRSTFATPVTSLNGVVNSAERAALEEGRAEAMLINGHIHVVDKRYTEATIPGIVAAQRMMDDRIVVVVAGLSGPATFGAAKLLKEFAAELPKPSPETGRATLVWAAVEVHVVAKGDALGDTRVPDRLGFIAGPEIWRPAD